MNYTDFENYFEKLKNFNIYVGFSGGADSTLILHIANYYRHKFKFTLKAINFEHGIRGEESLADSMFCKQVCKKLNIPIRIISLDINPNTKNIEAVARKKRIEYYKKLCQNNSNTIVLLGHHFGDQLENFFLRLARGSNLSGLFGLRDQTTVDGIFIGRPLINYNKSDIINFLTARNITWCEDSTNNYNSYQRNYIRNKMLPNWFNQCNFIKGGLETSIKNLEIDNDFIERYADDVFNKLNTNKRTTNENVCIGSLTDWNELHPAIRFRVLKRFISILNNNSEVSRGVFEQFNKMLVSYDNTNHKTLKLNNYVELVIKGYQIYLKLINNTI